jgi:hypothetical protein
MSKSKKSRIPLCGVRAGGREARGFGRAKLPAIVGVERVPFTLAQLAVFRMVAKTGTFAAAALALSVSPPAVSKTMATLEQARALPLFILNLTFAPPFCTPEQARALPLFLAHL